jgi:hypothetical protein
MLNSIEIIHLCKFFEINRIKKRDPMKGPLKNPLARIKRGLVKTKNLVVFP